VVGLQPNPQSSRLSLARRAGWYGACPQVALGRDRLFYILNSAFNIPPAPPSKLGGSMAFGRCVARGAGEWYSARGSVRVPGGLRGLQSRRGVVTPPLVGSIPIRSRRIGLIHVDQRSQTTSSEVWVAGEIAAKQDIGNSPEGMDDSTIHTAEGGWAGTQAVSLCHTASTAEGGWVALTPGYAVRPARRRRVSRPSRSVQANAPTSWLSRSSTP